MSFSTVTALLTLISAIVVWWMLYILFTSTKKSEIAIVTFVIAILLFPYYSKAGYFLYGSISKWLYQRNANGEIQLDDSSLKRPANAPSDYCNQFTDDRGDPLTMNWNISKDKMYCGYFWGLVNNNEQVVFVPYKLLPNNKVEYWADPDLKIVGSITEQDEKVIQMNK